jgi:hypothetical protein
MSDRDYPSIGLALYLLLRLKNFLQHHEKKENLLVKKLKQLLLNQYLHYFENDYEQMELLKVSNHHTFISFKIIIFLFLVSLIF